MSPHSAGTSSPMPASLPRRSFKLHLLPMPPLTRLRFVGKDMPFPFPAFFLVPPSSSLSGSRPPLTPLLLSLVGSVVWVGAVLASDFMHFPSLAAMVASLFILVPSAAVAVLEFAVVEPALETALVSPSIVPVAPSMVGVSWGGEKKAPPVAALERSAEQFG